MEFRKKELSKELENFRPIVKILDMSSNVCSITISPKYELSDPKFLFESYKESITKILNGFSKYYILYPEFGMKNLAQPRLHFHGIIKIHDMVKFYKTIHTLHKLVGFTKIDKIKDHNNHMKWLMYCQKEYAATHHILPVIIYKNRRRRKRSSPKEEILSLSEIPPHNMDIKMYYKYIMYKNKQKS